ncbi:hypothetical protein BLAT2472_20554 [Burkholderia latens]
MKTAAANFDRSNRHAVGRARRTRIHSAPRLQNLQSLHRATPPACPADARVAPAPQGHRPGLASGTRLAAVGPDMAVAPTDGRRRHRMVVSL